MRELAVSERTAASPPTTAAASLRVALVSMPFGPDPAVPSIQLGLLQAIARDAGFATDAYHLYLDLAQRLSPKVYAAVGDYQGPLTGEWLFSVAAFERQAQEPDEAYLRTFPDAALPL